MIINYACALCTITERNDPASFSLTPGYEAYTVISRKVVGKNVHATIPKGNMGYAQYTVPDNVAVQPTFVPFV